MSRHKFMIHLRGAPYANELYNMDGENIYTLNKARLQAEKSFPKCEWEIYNGEEGYSNYES